MAVACVLNRPFAIFACTQTHAHKPPILTHALIIRGPNTHTFVHLIDCGHVGCGVFMECGVRCDS